MAFHDLPVETLVDIGSRLNTSSVLSLGLANKACRAACLARWAEATNFSCLRRLDLDCVDEGAVQWLLNAPSLESLRDLRLGSDILSPSPLGQLSGVLARLPPLRELSIDGAFDGQHLNSLILQQGDRGALRELTINSSDYTFDQLQITQLLEHCPNVQSLTIHTQRTQGDRTEYELYRTFGRFPCPHKLVLSLGCKTIDEPGPRPGDQFYCPDDGDKRRRSKLLPIERSFGRYENQRCPIPDDYGFEPLRNGHVMRRLANGAIDESLATSIWKAISSAKPLGNTPLQSLQLLPHKNRYFHAFNEMQEVIEQIQLQWTLERSAETVKARSKSDCAFMMQEGERPCLPLAAVMEELWPGIMDEGKDWTTLWRSQPLWNPEEGVSRRTLMNLRLAWCLGYGWECLRTVNLPQAPEKHFSYGSYCSTEAGSGTSIPLQSFIYPSVNVRAVSPPSSFSTPPLESGYLHNVN